MRGWEASIQKALSRTVFCVLLAGLLGAAAPAWALRAANYSPLFNNPAASWTDNIPNGGGGIVTASVLFPFFTVNGITVRAIQRTGAVNSTQYYTNDANGIVLYQEFDPQAPTGNPSAPFVDETITLNPGLTYAAAEMVLNQRVNSSGTATFTFGPPLLTVPPQVLNYTAFSTVQALNEPVTVRAGTFNETVKLFTTLHIFGTLFAGTADATPFDMTATQTIWAVKDLGTVQEVDDGDNVHPAQLTASSVPALAPFTGTVTFIRQPVGTTSAPQQVTLSSTGTTSNISSPFIQVSGDFALSSNTCGPVVAQGSPCTIGITFSPTAPGTRNGTGSVYIFNDFSYPHQVISLVGGSMYTPRDSDGNGKSDVFWRHTNGTTLVWQMNGTGIASTGSPATVSDANWKVEGVGDFDGDGKADLLWTHELTGTVFVWLMHGTTIASTGSPATVEDASAGWVVQRVGDFDGDGNADVLWQNTGSGNVYVWLMNGTAISTTGSPATVSESNWQVQNPK